MSEIMQEDPSSLPLDEALGQSETAIGDGGFSHTVMARLPKRKLSFTAARRWTLGGAAVIGSLATVLVGGPLQTAFGALTTAGGYQLTLLAALGFVGLITIPVAWVLYSR